MSAPDFASIDRLLRRPSPPRAEVSRAICHRCTSTLAPQRGLSSRSRLIASLALAATLVLLFFEIGRQHHPLHWASPRVVLGSFAWALVQVVILWVGAATPPGRRLSAGVRLVIAVLTPVAFVAYFGFLASEWASFAEFCHGERAAHAIGCGRVGISLSALVTGSVFLLWRRTDPLTPGLTGALLGVVGSVAAGLALAAGCSSHEGWHVCVAHGLGTLAFSALGFALGRRWLSP